MGTNWRKLLRIPVIGYVILVLGVAASDFGYVHVQEQRRHDACIARRDLYDGEFIIIDFAAHELHATPEQIRGVKGRLGLKLGHRPDC